MSPQDSPHSDPRPQAGGAASAESTPIERYLQHLAAERRLSPHTVANYRRDLETLMQFADGRPLDALTSTDLRRAIVGLRAQGLAATSVARHLSSWRGFYTYACRRLGLTAN
ncbi:MAG: site-specific integrase, partial [Gammaproteobacteria bacterium]